MSSVPSKTDIHKRLNDFSHHLQRKGLKLTSQRVLVARKIFTTDSHFTVDDLADKLKKQRNVISRATIYRIVSVMVDAGLLTEHDFGKSSKFYEHTYTQGHHDHIICLDCGRIEEFCNDKIEELQLKVANRLGFEIAHHSLNLYGSCQKLRKNRSCPHKKKS